MMIKSIIKKINLVKKKKKKKNWYNFLVKEKIDLMISVFVLPGVKLRIIFLFFFAVRKFFFFKKQNIYL